MIKLKEVEMKIEKAKKRYFNEIKKIYVYGVIDEFKTQYTKKKKKEALKESDVKNRLKEIKKILGGTKKQSILVVVNQEEVIGFCHTKILKNNIGLIDKIYIDKKFRKKGVAKTLLDNAFNWLKRNKVKQIRAQIFVKNKPSIELFKSFKFKPRNTTWELVRK